MHVGTVVAVLVTDLDRTHRARLVVRKVRWPVFGHLDELHEDREGEEE